MPDSEYLEKFREYLSGERHASDNTMASYLRDITQYAAYLAAFTDTDLRGAEIGVIDEYISWMKLNGKSNATIARCAASLKCFYSFLFSKDIVLENPALDIVTEKAVKKLPQILTGKEVELLLEQPDCSDMKGYRDKAMLELLYATGIRVT